MTYSSVAILALLIHVLVNFDVLRGQAVTKKEKPAFRSYRRFLFSVMLFYIADAFWGILYDAHLIGLVYTDTVLYFVAMALSILLWTAHVIDYLHLKGRSRMVLRLTGWLFFLLQILALFVNLFWPIQFGFDTQTGAYHAGPVRYAALFLQIVMFLLTAVSALLVSRHFRGRVRLRYQTVGIFGLIMTVTIVLQVAFPLQPLYSVGCLLGTCLLHTFVLGDEKEEHRRELEFLLRREQEQREALDSARAMAHTDALTGVGNPHAYVDAQLDVDQRIADGVLTAFAVMAFDLNRLKEINDTQGHEVGDRYLCAACDMIVRSFPNSRVFRVGGDEFVAILEADYADRAARMAAFNRQVEENLLSGKGAVVSAGMGEFRPGLDFACHTVFTRADKMMYERKQMLHEKAEALR